MKENCAEVVFILDRSGSMSGLESDTIGGFNSLVERQKKEGGEVLVSTVLFDDRQEVLYDRIPIGKIPAMTDKDYYVRGCTALLDAVGGAIHHISNVHKYIREEDRPARTLFVITTDGYENASREYTYQSVKELIEQKKKEGWEFIFMGANIDAVSEAAKFGIGQKSAVNYRCDEAGTRKNFSVVSNIVSQMSHYDCSFSEDSINAQLNDIREDYKKRK